jgi:3-oxoacyl-[acyl-carrier-protein] synthase-3
MKSYIKAISCYLPEKILANEELVAEFPEWTVDKVASKVGISRRHIAERGVTAGDMAVKAAESLFAEYEVDRSTVDFVLLCTQSPDYPLPTTACILQDRLKIPTRCGALDFNLGCSGYVYGLSLANGLIVSGAAKNVLFLTSEVYTQQLHPQDKGNRTIFGDAATATLISSDGYAEIGAFCLGTDGSGAENLILRSGGRKNPEPMPETVAADGTRVYPNHIQMNGAEVFNFTLTMVPPLVEETMRNNALRIEQIDLFVFHQANKFMLNTLRKLCRIESERFYYCMEDVGNTVSNSIPIALKKARDEAAIKQNAKVLVAGFGVGYSWAGCVLQY